MVVVVVGGGGELQLIAIYQSSPLAKSYKQTVHTQNAASELGKHCLHMSPKPVFSLKRLDDDITHSQSIGILRPLKLTSPVPYFTLWINYRTSGYFCLLSLLRFVIDSIGIIAA